MQNPGRKKKGASASVRPRKADGGRVAAKPSGERASRGTARREAILAAALEEFAIAGFAATRLDDVARRAGVAKGTIYLYFSDKETLFQELLRSMFAPIIGAIETFRAADLPARQLAERMVDVFVREILATRRKDVIRLILTEGPRFPKLAEFHFREVIGRLMPVIGEVLARAAQRGEVDPELARFPQLLVAPGIVAILWKALFDRFAPLDAEAMMRAYLDILFRERKAS